MEVQIKKAVKAGNSSAVTLPRAWLNQEVRVELIKKTNNIILSETIDLLSRHLEIKNVIGIYLCGSYARGEEEKDSDIDVLIITDNIDKEIIKEGIYNFLVISQELLKQKLTSDLFPVGQMILEAKPLLNASYLNSLNVTVTPRNIKWYLETTKEKLNLLGKVINLTKDDKKYVSDSLTYTLILRIRTLEIIKKIINNEAYSKKDFLRLIKNISGMKNAYESYLAIKNDLSDESRTTLLEVKKLYEYLIKQLALVTKKLEIQ